MAQCSGTSPGHHTNDGIHHPERSSASTRSTYLTNANSTSAQPINITTRSGLSSYLSSEYRARLTADVVARRKAARSVSMRRLLHRTKTIAQPRIHNPAVAKNSIAAPHANGKTR